jgi:hypothetical protein
MFIGANSQLNIEYLTASNEPSASAQFLLARARGSLSNPASVQADDRIAIFIAVPFGTESGDPKAGNAGTGFLFEIDGEVVSRNPPTRITFIGLGPTGNVFFAQMNGTRFRIPLGTESENTTSGALQVFGGAGITGNLHVGGTINGLGAVQPGTPASPTAAGTAGEIRWDSNHIYVCTQTGTTGNAAWKRVDISTWTP